VRTLAFIFIYFISIAISAQNESLFEKANAAYNAGNYAAAITSYEQILQQKQHSAALYYNLGNAHYKLNNIAPSIYYYEKALLLKPDDSEIQNNLSYANNMTLDAIEPMPEVGLSKFYKDLVGWQSFDRWAYIAVGFMMLFVLFYIAFYFFHYATRKRIAFIISLFCALFSCISVGFAFASYSDFNKDQPAIVFESEIAVRPEANERGQAVFTLHEGTKVQVIEALAGYQKIEISDGKTGWVPKESIKLLKNF